MPAVIIPAKSPKSFPSVEIILPVSRNKVERWTLSADDCVAVWEAQDDIRRWLRGDRPTEFNVTGETVRGARFIRISGTPSGKDVCFGESKASILLQPQNWAVIDMMHKTVCEAKCPKPDAA